MNLHGIASEVISTLVPSVEGTVRLSSGYVAAADGAQVPGYEGTASVRLCIQPLTWQDIQKLDGMNIQGTRRKIYVHGRLDGLVRSILKGGDLIIVGDADNHQGTWLVVQVLEQWRDWCSVAVTLQNR